MQLISGLLGLLAASKAANAFQLWPSAFGIPGVNATYDYVVVGGGTAGNTIAARLAEAGWSVAVIEAGDFYQTDNGNNSVIPGVATTQYTGSDPEDVQPLIDWGYVTTPQPGAGGRRLHYASGKTLGGGSARNYFVYHRGTIGSYQKWADEVGDQSYTFANLLKFFKRSVNLTPPNEEKRFDNATVRYNPAAFASSNDSSYHRPLSVTWGNWAAPIATWARLGMEAIGIPPADDTNSGELHGSSWTPSTVDVEMHRESSQTSFLDYAIQSTTGLQVYTKALARKILFDGNATATGVVVTTAGYNFTLSATREVILSAGTFRSPQMLMVSGVGPSETLQKFDIPVVSDLAGVGQNLWDQPFGFGISYRVNVLTGSNFALDPVFAANAVASYLANATGPLAAPASFLAYERISDAAPELLSDSTIEAIRDCFPADWPEVEYLAADGYFGYNRNYMTGSVVDGYNYATISPVLITPFSRGNVTISSADMSDYPVINPNWLNTPEDKDIAIAGFKRARQVWENMGNVTIGEEYFPGPNVTTDAEILEFIQKSVIEIYHASATCKMGRANDSMAVVDPRARVYGVNSLRVVDASAFPFLTPGHPQSGIYMLAEKIADDILTGGTQEE
ncbi:GMC oxidoreductase [Hortaea werneckii]|uniref:Glucose-methanol-choline oxidoreductase N-terminal domain-containing protein n=1 Tax=Hortaea werneckii TaxID=91943 RepID=A0A3M6ZVW7_HORWE|nr:GMC oxidoreductase [Hortaea werneckii]KAI7002622.1 GMC oxidoreductase [Hortaea werneckii]KAI7675323.1 GMC oxidoreductase [Hortaea werneckii]RMY12694.1 hypothetical protein D0866_14180 [Hortaea werneckii]RMY19464.1 hypothetical protein D0867_04669 [Hortaea werneckii]